jgi:hypothetical protein
LLALVKGLSAQVEALTARVSLLGTEDAELRVDNAGLRAENPPPKRKLGTDSSNSSAPPSRDSSAAKGKRRARRSQRVRSKAGSQVASRHGMVRVWCRLPSRIGPRLRRFPRTVRGEGRILSMEPMRARPGHRSGTLRRSGSRRSTTCWLQEDHDFGGAAAEVFGRSGRLGPWRTGRTSMPRRSCWPRRGTCHDPDDPQRTDRNHPHIRQ